MYGLVGDASCIFLKAKPILNDDISMLVCHQYIRVTYKRADGLRDEIADSHLLGLRVVQRVSLLLTLGQGHGQKGQGHIQKGQGHVQKGQGHIQKGQGQRQEGQRKPSK